MIYVTQEEFEATALNMIYAIGQLTNALPSESTIERCKSELLKSGMIKIINEGGKYENN